MRTRIKICGITRAEDARVASALGVDAIGLVFYSHSARAVSVATAPQIAAAAGPFVTRVGVFLNAQPTFVREVLAAVALDMVQFHGEEDPKQCAAFGVPYLKAVAMGADLDVAAYTRRYPGAAAFLVDSHRPNQAGGSGLTADWARVPSSFERPLILAGGLSVANVARAMSVTRPFGLDVSTAVEADKGIKDAAKMAAFIDEVKRVDCSGQ